LKGLTFARTDDESVDKLKLEGGAAFRGKQTASVGRKRNKDQKLRDSALVWEISE